MRRSVIVRTVHAGDSLEVQIEDSGPGIPVEERGKLYEAFYTTKPDGTGIGLTISRTIVEDHGGSLWAKNNDGPGATFHFSLPVDVSGVHLEGKSCDVG